MMLDEDAYAQVCDETSSRVCTCGHVEGFHVDKTKLGGERHCVELNCSCSEFQEKAAQTGG